MSGWPVGQRVTQKEGRLEVIVLVWLGQGSNPSLKARHYRYPLSQACHRTTCVGMNIDCEAVYHHRMTKTDHDTTWKHAMFTQNKLNIFANTAPPGKNKSTWHVIFSEMKSAEAQPNLQVRYWTRMASYRALQWQGWMNQQSEQILRQSTH